MFELKFFVSPRKSDPIQRVVSQTNPFRYEKLISNEKLGRLSYLKVHMEMCVTELAGKEYCT